ncbi:MAG: SUMF1/EgtB/PvdO family nonheme iron enzyme [Deltaproteobacteria bacterium]
MHSKLVSVGALCMTFAACAKLVGITDTTVTRDDESDESVAAAQGGSGGSATEGTMSPAAGATGGSGGRNGPAGAPSSAAGAGATGETLPNPALDAGLVPDAGEGPCTDQATRCGMAGREVCSAGGWQASSCPLNQPTCEDGQCVVRGPALISVGSFFIDATEVTVGQYQQFLAAKGSDVSGQSAVCSWNQSYYEGAAVMRPSEYPMTSVDWCDAAAYCAWAGKHLCGRIGGGAIARADIFEADLSQWFVSCGGGGNHPNNNPSTPDNPRCNSSQGFSGVAAVASYPLCEGYYPGLFDMEGNVSEWIDACDGSAGASDVCYLMGGSTLDSVSYCDEVSQDAQDPWLRSTKTVYDGFRCCAG